MGDLIRHKFEQAAGNLAPEKNEDLGKLLTHDFGDARQYESNGLLRKIIENSVREKDSLGQSVEEELNSWAKSLAIDEGEFKDLRKAIAEDVRGRILDTAPKLKEALDALEDIKHQYGKEIVTSLKYQQEVYRLRSYIYKLLLHDASEAEHYTKLADRIDGDLESISDFIPALFPEKDKND